MQETRNSCFGSKKHSTTLLQAKTGKHECRNVTATYFGTHAYLFSPDEGSCYVFSTRATFFRPETIFVSFSHLIVIFFKVLLNHSSKRQFWCSIVVYKMVKFEVQVFLKK